VETEDDERTRGKRGDSFICLRGKFIEGGTEGSDQGGGKVAHLGGGGGGNRKESWGQICRRVTVHDRGGSTERVGGGGIPFSLREKRGTFGRPGLGRMRRQILKIVNLSFGKT